MGQLKIPVTLDDHIHGNDNASIFLVEYGDYECSHCGEAQQVIQKLQSNFKDQLALVYRHFPLREVHPYAELAAMTAEFAGFHGLFWEMHELLYTNQRQFNELLFKELVQALDLSVSEYEHCIQKKQYEKKIRQEFLGGVRSGVNGTPTFFINTTMYQGDVSVDSLSEIIQSTLIHH